jgi:hypothetical protein
MINIDDYEEQPSAINNDSGQFITTEMPMTALESICEEAEDSSDVSQRKCDVLLISNLLL